MSEIAARFSALAELTEVLVALYDPEDRLFRANHAFREAFAIAEGEHPSWAEVMCRNHGKGRGSVISSDDFENWLASARSRRGKLPYRAFEADLLDGRWLWMTETTDRDGWMLCIASDITSLRAEERELRRDRDLALKASQTDALTGISNRRSMVAQLDALVRRGAMEGRPGSICIMDIDFFKQINDVHGHQVGDAVLLDFTRRVQPFLRGHDCFGRIGGEEFMLLLPDTGLLDAEAVINRVLAVIRDARPLPEAPGISYSCSAGLAAYMAGDTSQTLYARADAALYAAKRAGRDRWESR